MFKVTGLKYPKQMNQTFNTKLFSSILINLTLSRQSQYNIYIFQGNVLKILYHLFP